MPAFARYVLKDSHPAVLEWAKKTKTTSPPSQKKGSLPPTTSSIIEAYECKPASTSSSSSNDNNSVNVKEVLFGLQMAMLSITDDQPNTLKNVGKMNPWQIQSVKLIVGGGGAAAATAGGIESEDDLCYQPLTKLLMDHFQLTLDHHIYHSGLTKAGHALDTQGFIAHNDGTVVLAYRCTTSASDWLTNLTTTTSAFEPDEDVLQGHSGFLSCFDCFSLSKANLPLVHTGFYNNFLSSIPDIKQYIDPLILNHNSDRTLYIAGHSLGAGIATIAACYFLLDPLYSKVKIRIVTAGGPRSVSKSMEQRMVRALSDQDAKFYRCVRDKDGVPNVPPEFLGFRHIGTTVFITKADKNSTGKHHLIINPGLVVPKKVYQALVKEHPDLKMGNNTDDDDDDEDDADDENDNTTTTAASKAATEQHQQQVAKKLKEQAQAAQAVAESNVSYNQKIAAIPRPLRDHMPEFYLLPLYAAVVEADATK